ncbi:Hypothetical protein, putative [Bodo saltans]|uniref:Uncharacterized protein n=1 Tax=Bodo saltans TaxID=75058 RepID=A0A0S4J3S7_BODSA|nr:Hypothetical protein, putative [Bodo saltans]|eukprot:CUG86075.1 Hypothetical protein, putative [Bodo saltans]
MAASNLSKDDLLKLSVRLTKAMETEEFKTKVRARLEEKNTPPTQAVMEEFEVIQVETLASWGQDGNSILRQLKMAVRTFPEPDTRMAISQLCSVEEKILMELSREVATRFGQVIPEHDHGHSHNGKPCHGHGQASHGHSHESSHGHSHNGQPCHGHGHDHGHGQPNQQQMMAMQMAIQSLPKDQKVEFDKLQQKMMSGQQPTADDQKKMMAIQQHLIAFMSTMQQLQQQTTAAATAKK